MRFLSNKCSDTSNVSIETLNDTKVSLYRGVWNIICKVSSSSYTNSIGVLDYKSRNRSTSVRSFFGNYITKFVDLIIDRSSIFFSGEESLISSWPNSRTIIQKCIINAVGSGIDVTIDKPVCISCIILYWMAKVTR